MIYYDGMYKPAVRTTPEEAAHQVTQLLSSMGQQNYGDMDEAGKIRMDNAFQAGEAERLSGLPGHSASWWLAMIQTAEQTGIPLEQLYQQQTGMSPNFEVPPVNSDRQAAAAYNQKYPYEPFKLQSGNQTFSDMLSGSGKQSANTSQTGGTQRSGQNQINPSDVLLGDESWFWDEAPDSAYMQKYGIKAMGNNPFQNWLASQYGPTYSTYLAESALNPGDTAPLSWMNYLGNRGYAGARQSAGNLFNKALSGDQNYLTDILGEGELQNFMTNVLKNYYAAPIAERLGSKAGALKSQYVGETGGQGNNFLDYLRDKYGLKSLL
jgi:hypothetical protein